MNKKTVVVGMSGGVDSSVAALLLKKQNFNVIGLFMKNWEEEDRQGHCLAAKDYEDVVKVCEKLNVPYYSINFAKEYKERVFQNFIEEYKKGFTPNPDILCNKEIKFNLLLAKARSLGADFLATGHYAKIIHKDEEKFLAKAFDDTKDQSYFLYTLTSAVLAKVIFPLSDLTKKEVREIAKKEGLSTHNKKDSTGICFIGKRDFRPFLAKFIGFQEGDIETIDGKKVGRHVGASFYTLGQREGLKIGGKGDAWFVAAKDLKRNVLIVVQGKHHPALFCDELQATNLSWINTPPQLPCHCLAKIRYRQADQPCTIIKIEEDLAFVRFETPQRAATPSQSIVFYDKEICLGGGIIKSIGPSYYHLNKSLPFSSQCE
jgi:tRNA-uridine 2-sulfurtransferase